MGGCWFGLVLLCNFLSIPPLFIDSTVGSLRSALLLGTVYSPLIYRICMEFAGSGLAVFADFVKLHASGLLLLRITRPKRTDGTRTWSTRRPSGNSKRPRNPQREHTQKLYKMKQSKTLFNLPSESSVLQSRLLSPDKGNLKSHRCPASRNQIIPRMYYQY